MTIIQDDLLFHAVHGLCRVATVTSSTSSKEASYCLLPVSMNRAKVRFIVPESSWENSGFNKLISVKEANAILSYFKTGEKKDSECGEVWDLSVMIWSESSNKSALKDTRKRQSLQQGVKGLAGQLAFVLNMTLKEVGEKIQRNLGAASKINPLVVAALANVERD